VHIFSYKRKEKNFREEYMDMYVKFHFGTYM